MKNFYFVFENNKECKYYYKNVLAELENGTTYFGMYSSNDKDLTITKKVFSIKETNLLKKIFNKLRNRNYTSTTYDFKDSVTYHFLNVKNFSADNKDMNNVYYIKKSINDYTDYILDIMGEVR